MALAYAKERKQGRAPGAPAGEQSLDHRPPRRAPDAAHPEGLDRGAARDHLRQRRRHRPRRRTTRTRPSARRTDELADILTPVSKGWGTDLGVELTSLALQVFGGMGYIEETGVAQHYRDARIAPIYEGTNGIQAMDLVGRKLPMRGGAAIADYLGYIEATVEELAGAGDDLASIRSQPGRRARRRCARPPTGCSPTAWPTRSTRWPAPRPTCGCSASSPAAGRWRCRPRRRPRSSADATGDDKAFLEGKVLTARFFCEQLLPQAAGLVPAVTATNRDLAAAVL